MATNNNRSDDKVLLEQSRVITNVWKGFMKKDSLRQVFKAAGLKDLDESNPPTIDTLVHVIKGIQDTKDAKGRTFGEKVTANIRSFAGEMNAHKHLFSVFPNESIYTSILSGVVSSLVVVSKHRILRSRNIYEFREHRPVSTTKKLPRGSPKD